MHQHLKYHINNLLAHNRWDGGRVYFWNRNQGFQNRIAWNAPLKRRVSQNFCLLQSVKLCHRTFPLVAVCWSILASWFYDNNITYPQLKWHHVTPLFWDRSWSQIVRTSVSIDGRVSKHSSRAVSIRRKVLQNQNSATLCDALRHLSI